LKESNYDYQSLTQAVQILTQVISISGGSDTITQEFEKTELLLNSYNQFLNKKYNLAIKGFEELRTIDPNYAGRKVKYLLYESYLAYGEVLYKNADFTGARDQYLKAETYAWTDSDHIIRAFLVELKVAKVLDQLWAPGDSASHFHYAFGLINFRQHLLDTENQHLLSLIDNAEAAFTNKQMRDSITLFEQAVEEKDKLFDYATEKVFNGDALSDIAFHYGCTIEIIKSANMLGDSLIIQLDQDLLIPIH
jgi:tetratricopeptide (TPR) repeat protein